MTTVAMPHAPLHHVPLPDASSQTNFAAAHRPLAQTATLTPATADRGTPEVARTPELEERSVEHVAG